MKRTVLLGIVSVVIPVFSAALSHEIVVKQLEIVHPYTLEPSDPTIKDVTVRMTIHNRSKNSDRLVSASSPIAAVTHIEGGAQANEKSVNLPAGKTVTLTRDGARIELKGLTKGLVAYDSFPLSLTFEKTGKVDVEVMVEENNAGAGEAR